MMVMGLAPVVGVPLPLVSFGGSAVMTVMLCLGLLMALERQQRTVSRLDLSGLKCGGCAPAEPMLPAPPLQSAKPPEHPPHGSGRIAQLVEQLTLNQRVLGSSPSASTIFSVSLAIGLSKRLRQADFAANPLFLVERERRIIACDRHAQRWRKAPQVPVALVDA